MRFPDAMQFLRREFRGARGRLFYFAACLAIGVAAVVGVAALTESVTRSFQAGSRVLFGADFGVEASQPLPDDLAYAMADVPGAERTDVVESITMASVPPREGAPAPPSTLVQLTAVEGRYPLYGAIITDPPGGLSIHLAPDTVVPSTDLLDSLGLSVGDDLRIGGRSYRIAARAVKTPPKLRWNSLLGPTVYLSREGFERSGLGVFGARLEHRALFALPGHPSEEELEAIIAQVRTQVPEWLDFDHHYEEGPGRRGANRRLGGFTGLLALLSLVVGGIGVSLIVRAWLADRTRALAVMRCLGMRPGEILVLALGQTALLALAGSALGAGIGCALPFAVQAFAPDLLPVDVKIVVPLGAILRGVGLGVGLALAFSLPPLAAIWRVSPARVLRSDAEPLPPNLLVGVAAMLFLAVGVYGAAYVQAGEVLPALLFTNGLFALIVALYAGARLLVAAARLVPRTRLSPYLRHGIAALARPGAGSVGVVVSLGLGTMVVAGTLLIDARLREGILMALPPDAPTVFLIDVPPSEREGVEAELRRAGAERIDQAPLVTGRIAEIDGVPVERIAIESDDVERARRNLSRERRLTFQDELPRGAELVAGELWSDPDRWELSLEREFAERMGIGLGTRVTFDVLGMPVETTVTSIREVEWVSLSFNFFLVLEPGSLDDAPVLYLASARLPPENERPLADRIAADHPNVTVIPARGIIEQAVALLTKLTLGIRILGGFTVLAGLAILAGAVSAAALRRGGEVALLKTLGVTRRGVAVLLAIEYGLLGAVAGTVGACGALLLGYGFLGWMEIDLPLPLSAIPLAALACGALTALCGAGASARALAVPPIAALRTAGA